MSLGVWEMAEAISDTGPILHLHEINRLVIGSVGVLVRAYRTGLLERNELDIAVDGLFEESTLHLSSAFRAYLRKLLSDLR